MANLVCSVDVDRPVDAVYAQWRRLETLPAVLGSVVSVRRIDDHRTHWVVRIRGEQRDFEARTTEEIPEARLAWSAAGGASHAGVVTFHRLTEGRCRITLQLDWAPQGLFDQVGDRFGFVRRAIDADLQAFARHVEATTAVPASVALTSDHEEAAVTGPGTVAGLGHRADAPGEIPRAGYKQVLKRTLQQLKSDNVTVVAGGVAFFSFLALIPALAAVVSIYGLVADPADVRRQLDSVLDALPQDAAQLLQSQLVSITTTQAAGLGLAAVVGVLGSLWSAAKGMQSMIAALNIAYDEEETRKGLRLRALTLGMTVAMALGAVALVGGMVVLGAVASRLGTVGGLALTIVRWPVLLGALVLVLALLYRYAPDRDDAEWRWVTPGAAIAGALMVLASLAFALYVNNFGSYSETYGSLGAIVVLLLWMQLMAFVAVLGAEFDAEMERQTAKDTTVGRRQPMGARDAHAADTVAA